MSLWSRECPVCADIGWCNDHPIKDHDDMTTKPNEPEALEPCPNPWCGSTTSHIRHFEPDQMRACGIEGPWRRDCDNCGVTGPCADTRDLADAAWNLRAPAQPVADAGGVTDADREAADAISVALLQCVPPDTDLTHFRLSVADLFARHRLQSVAAATAGKDAEIARLRKALGKISDGRTIRFTGSEHHNRPLRDKDAQVIARAALSEAREAGDTC